MDRYFTGEVTQPFEMFTELHWITLAALAVINIALIYWCRKFRGSCTVRNFRYWLAGFLVLNEFFFMGWCVYAGVWSLDYSLPVHLCDAAMFLCAFMLIYENYLSFETAYFWSLGGSLQALLTPDLAYSFPHCQYWNFFMGHGALLTAVFYMIAVYGFKPSFKSILRMLAFTNLFMVFAALVNLFTGGNYMFLRAKPPGGSIMDFLGPWPWYILSLEGVTVVLCLICWAPFPLWDMIKKRSAGTASVNSQNPGVEA